MAGKTSYTKAPAAAVKKVLRARGKAKSTPVGGDTAELTAASIDEVSPVVTKKKTKKSAAVKEDPAFWCDASVAKMFELRYKTELKDKFKSKNNFQKNLAALSLAARLSVAMNRTFSAAQVNAKFARMRTKWLTSKSTVPSSTGNEASSGSLPMHYDVMLEYWSGKDDPVPAIDDPLPAADDSTSVGGDTAASIDEVPPVVTKKKAKKSAAVVEEPAVWCDASVAKMFELRYKTELKDKFESKNNFQKNLATLSLAATLSVAMNRTFTAAQVNAKFARMRTKWSTSKSTVPSSTGNDASSGSLPMHYDVMLEYWSGNDDLQRERLLSSDDPVDLADDTGNADSDVMDLDDENERPDNANKKRKTCSETEDKTTGDRGGGKKIKSTGEAIEGGLVAVSNGLISLGQSLAPGRGAAQSNTTLDDVLDAIKAQSTTALAEQVSYLVDAIKSQTNTMQQLIQAIAKK